MEDFCRQQLLHLGYDNEYLNHIQIVEGTEEAKAFEEEVKGKCQACSRCEFSVC